MSRSMFYEKIEQQQPECQINQEQDRSLPPKPRPNTLQQPNQLCHLAQSTPSIAEVGVAVSGSFHARSLSYERSPPVGCPAGGKNVVSDSQPLRRQVLLSQRSESNYEELWAASQPVDANVRRPSLPTSGRPPGSAMADGNGDRRRFLSPSDPKMPPSPCSSPNRISERKRSYSRCMSGGGSKNFSPTHPYCYRSASQTSLSQVDQANCRYIFSEQCRESPPLPPRNPNMALLALIACIDKDLTNLNGKTKECDSFWQQLKEQQSHFVIKVTEIQQLRMVVQHYRSNGHGSGQQKLDQLTTLLESASRQAGVLYQTLVTTRKEILLSLNTCAELIIKLRNDLVHKSLLEWKRGQKLAQIGFPFERQDELLDKIAHHFELLADEIWNLRSYCNWVKDLLQQAPNVPDSNVQQCMTVLQPISASITKELELLVRESFIVSKQPNVVLKQHNKFTAETRLLVGDRLGIKVLNLKVGVKLISEDQARALKDGGLLVQHAATVAKIGLGPAISTGGDSQEMNLEAERESGRMRACFKSRLLKVDPRKSGGKNNDDQQQMLVCERNYALLFSCSQFQLGDIAFPCIWTLSLPVKLTVHGSQERLSQAMILWDHAFAPPEAPFNVPEAVEWSLLAEALKSKFMVQTGVTRPLSKSDLDYLCEKLFGGQVPQTAPGKQLMVSLQRFCKDPMLEDVDFSFWSWFFEIMNLIKQKLQRFWDDGFVKGFIGRSAASELLLSQQQSSFLLRFSDTHLGGLSISFVCQVEDGHREVFPLSPFTVKDLDHLSLAQRIAGCPQLQRVETICGSDGMLFEKSAIFRKEAEMALRQRPSVPFDKDGHPYILSDLVMIARISNRAGTDSSPISPATHGGWSPGGESSNILDDIPTDAWEGPHQEVDWLSLGIAPGQMLVDEHMSDNFLAMACKVATPSSCAIEQAAAAEAIRDLLRFMNDDTVTDSQFHRQMEESGPSSMDVVTEMAGCHLNNQEEQSGFRFE